MLIIPALDIKKKNCVRLKQGKEKKETIFSTNPADVALYWAFQNVRRLHIIDLDGAFCGKPKNYNTIKLISKKIKNFCIKNNKDIKIQLGGGIRNFKDIELYFKENIHYIILGTQAIQDHKFLKSACKEFPGKILVSLDAKYGKIATHGWTKISKYTVKDLARKFEDYGCESIIYTDISRDGMMTGINLINIIKLAENLNIPLIPSGGVNDISDVEYLYTIKGIKALICGRALYEGQLNFKKAQKLADSYYI